jgi:hypothetical protein
LKDKITDALAGLKDFQSKTVEYVYDQLYNKHRHKMLVADEVGLGKTIVAKGIIAKAFDIYLSKGGPSKDNPSFNVVYICSNLSLAKQNIRKLNFMGSEEYVEDIITRLNYLAYRPADKPSIFLINALTPGTSFDERSHQGEQNERAIIFRLLTKYSPFHSRRNGLKWLLKGNIKDIRTWEKKLKQHIDLRWDLFNKYRQELFRIKIDAKSFPRLCDHLNTKSELSVWHALLRVCERINGKNYRVFNFKPEVIRHLRRILSKLCLEYLNADIFILDEFQRYSNLIKLDDGAENPAIELARAIFEIKDAKILMLSATPFKPFTNDFDELNGEVHYKEFEAVLRFLMRDKSDEFWKEFQKDRKAFFSFLRQPEQISTNITGAINIKSNLESIYRDSIVRTERLLAAEERDALINSVLKNKPLEVHPEDIEEFVSLDRVTRYLNSNHGTRLSIPLEYTKSSPFAFSYLDNYQHKNKLEELFGEDPKLKNILKKTGHSWINLKNIDEYKSIIPRRSQRIPNAKLRLLIDQTIEIGGWRYLWIPPSINYYEPREAYKDSKGYSKALIFSSWVMVPKMISTLVSYEAERRCIANQGSISEKEQNDKKRRYFIKKRSPRPQFTFKVEKEDDEPQQMMNIAYLFPSFYLASIYNPIQNLKDQITIDKIKEYIKGKISIKLKSISDKAKSRNKGNWQKWYWISPLLFERSSSKKEIYAEWFDKGLPLSEAMVDSEDSTPQRNETSGKAKHFKYAAYAYSDFDKLDLPPLDKDQFDEVLDFLAELSLGSPAICYLRSQINYNELDNELLDASFNVAMGFITLFNKPESIAIVRLTTQTGNYIDRVLKYSIDGNIQSLLDEYIYLLRECENIKTSRELSEIISDVLTIRTSGTQVDDLTSFINRKSNGSSRRGKVLRTHFAADFGVKKIDTASASHRQINVRQAFNSPFRPFVLATTSIGQEGLDFHYYCKKIFHWNLPSNAIDLEQREGRIHRYLSLVIRQNVVDKYQHNLEDEYINDIWKNLFEIASVEKNNSIAGCELVPYWHTETKSNIKIERFVPLYPFSKDIDKYRQLLKILTLYRLTFGQPRQEELIEALYEGNYDGDIKDSLNALIINLSPLKFY